jgi:uncharacterized protein YybS (DUF2232 family)
LTFSLKSLAWSAAALILLLSLLSPLNAFTIFLIMTPFVVLFTMLKPASFVIHIAIIGAAAFVLSGTYGPFLVTIGFFFLVPAMAMSHMYKRKSSARSAITVGFTIILLQLLLEIAIFYVQFEQNLGGELTRLLSDNLKQFETNGMFKTGWATQTASQVSESIQQLLPTLLLLSACLLALVTHGLSRMSLRSIGVQTNSLPRAKDWRMPKSFVWYYLIALVASYFLAGGDYWSLAVTNLIPLLMFAFVVQGIGFAFFVADAKKWHRVVPFLLSIPIVLLVQPFYLIGLLDVAFPLRRYFVKS